MPLFDLFKKSPKKEPVKDDPFGSPELQKNDMTPQWNLLL